MRRYIISLLIKLILPGCHIARNPPKGRKKGITPAKLGRLIESGKIKAIQLDDEPKEVDHDQD